MTGDSPALGALRGVRIAHLIESDGPGGAERLVVQLATELRTSACEIVAFLPAKGEGWLGRELTAAGVVVEPFQLERPVSPASARRLAAAFHRLHVAVAHSHEFTMAVYGAWAAWRAGVGHVITMHGGRYYADRLRRRLALRAAIALSDKTVAVSERLTAELRADLWLRRSHVATIPNGVRFEAAPGSTLRTELGLTQHDRLILSIGNLYPVKGQRHLVQALAYLADRHPGLHLAIAGRGDLASSLVQQARALGVEHRLHLLGLRSDIPNLLAGADVFALPSLSEGLPLALLEAMFASRPIVASAVGEVPLALAGGAGILVEPGDPAALAASLDRVLSDPGRARRLGERAGRRAAVEYHLTRTLERYALLYHAALRRSAAAAGHRTS